MHVNTDAYTHFVTKDASRRAITNLSNFKDILGVLYARNRGNLDLDVSSSNLFGVYIRE